ncbi:hypothetical protein [Staphylococcus arlettae]|uniref:Uncharacterized protein n=1 Tax=Staphylococcus virus IME1354_01 TaxID=3070820 RepID=A0A1W6JQ61_9CAUD|nr:hypothetical protein PP279_gp30 [Staphylococcus virus IME1354_01]ARM68362.1 hypothetical protein [Staphylococcus virus IME1354_01]
MPKSKYYSTKQIREIINSYQIYEPHIHKEVLERLKQEFGYKEDNNND